MPKKKLTRKQMNLFVADYIYLPLTYLYFELLFNFSTVRNMSKHALLSIVLFSFCYGMVAVIVSFWPKNNKLKYVLQSLMMVIPAVAFLVEYFVFCQFKVLYDLNTVTHGAGDVAGQFTGDIKRMVFSASGMRTIFLFFLPLIVYIVMRILQYRRNRKVLHMPAEGEAYVSPAHGEEAAVRETEGDAANDGSDDDTEILKADVASAMGEEDEESTELIKDDLKNVLGDGVSVEEMVEILGGDASDLSNVSVPEMVELLGGDAAGEAEAVKSAALETASGQVKSAPAEESETKEKEAFSKEVNPEVARLFKKQNASYYRTGRWIGFAAVGVSMALFYLLSIVSVKINKVAVQFYDKEYNFEYAVQNFGYMTGLRKEIENRLTGRINQISFDKNPVITMPPVPTIPPIAPADSSSGEGTSDSGKTEGPTATPTPVVYGESKLDIDFAAMAASDSGTYKELDEYCAGLTPSKENPYTGLFKGKNLIFISAEAFSEEVIDENLTPTLYRLSHKGINFNDYYQFAGAGTTGGEFQNLFGMLPMAGGSSFKKTATYNNYFLITAQLNRQGYFGKAYHNNSYTFYDRHKTHINLGLSDGYMGYGNGMEKYVKSQWPQSDDEMFVGTMTEYIDKQPFCIYYMSVSGHSGYGKNVNAMSKKHWDEVSSLGYSDSVKGYIAANLDLELGLSHIVAELEAKGIADDTVIVISADHFPYGLDADGSLGNLPKLSELYGYNVSNVFQRDHNRLIIWSGSLEKSAPVVINSPVSSLDILPTLSNLFGVPWDSRLHPGRDVFSDAMPLVFDMGGDWKTDYGTYYSWSGKFEPKDASVTLPDGYVNAVKTIVRNKINYCKGANNSDYWGHVASAAGLN